MSIDRELLSLLVCPITKTAITPLDRKRLHKLNQAIAAHTVIAIGGETVNAEVQEALITVDGQTIYRIDDGIPIMLEEQAIKTCELADW